MDDDMTILEARGLYKSFGGLQALKNINIKVKKNQIHGLIGPNGAGKSTFFNVVSGLYPSTEGSIIFNSSDITHLPAEEINKMGISRTFQAGKLVSNITVLDNVMSGLYHPSPNPVRLFFLQPIQFKNQERDVKLNALEMLKFLFFNLVE